MLDVEEDDPEVVKFKAISCSSKKLHLGFSNLLGSQILSKRTLTPFSPSTVQTSSVQTDHEVVCRAGNQEEGAGSKRHAWKVNGHWIRSVKMYKSHRSHCHVSSLCSISGKGPERRKSKRRKKQSATESGRKILRFVSSPTWLPSLTRFRLCKSPFFFFSCQPFARKRETDAWTAGGTSRPKGRSTRKKRTEPSWSPPKWRWSSGNDALKRD